MQKQSVFPRKKPPKVRSLGGLHIALKRQSPIISLRYAYSIFFTAAAGALPQWPPVLHIKKSRRPIGSSGYSSQINNYLLENCGARRAALRPYFLRSFILGSRVKNPAFLREARRFSESYCNRARAIPWRIAPACPVTPPPATRQTTSNFSLV